MFLKNKHTPSIYIKLFSRKLEKKRIIVKYQNHYLEVQMEDYPVTHSENTKKLK